MVIERPDADFIARAGTLHRLGGIFQQVQEHLQQLVPVRISRGQRGVILFNQTDTGGKAHLGRAARAIQQVVQVDRLALGRAQVAELFNLIQQFHDPAAFGHDQIGQFQIRRIQPHRQQLGRAGDPRQRVLDFVGQHLGHANRGFRGGFGRLRAL